MVYLKGYESGYLECEIPKLSTTAYAFATFFSRHFTYTELSVISTFIMTVGEIMFLNSKEAQGCLPVGYDCIQNQVKK